MPVSSLWNSEESSGPALEVTMVKLPLSANLSSEPELTIDPAVPSSLTPASVVASVNSVAVADVSSEMSPISPVRSHGQNSPEFQSRHAEHRAQG